MLQLNAGHMAGRRCVGASPAAFLFVVSERCAKQQTGNTRAPCTCANMSLSFYLRVGGAIIAPAG